MILSIVIIIVTTFDPFFLLSFVSKIRRFCLSLVGFFLVLSISLSKFALSHWQR